MTLPLDDLPPDLLSLIEKRENSDRRTSERRTNDRRSDVDDAESTDVVEESQPNQNDEK